jgi:hypothetical protein
MFQKPTFIFSKKIAKNCEIELIEDVKDRKEGKNDDNKTKNTKTKWKSKYKRRREAKLNGMIKGVGGGWDEELHDVYNSPLSPQQVTHWTFRFNTHLQRKETK